MIQTPHPFSIAARKVIVDRDHVHTLARQGIEVHRESCDQGLALAGAHLGNLAAVQHHAADQLHIEVTHAQHALAGLAHHGKGFGLQIIQTGALRKTLAELTRLGLQLRVAQGADLLFKRIDLRNRLTHALDQSIVTTAKHLLHHFAEHANSGLLGGELKGGMIPQGGGHAVFREMTTGAAAERGNQGARM